MGNPDYNAETASDHSCEAKVLRGLLAEVCAANKLVPYRGWDIPALNRVVEKIRRHLDLPSTSEINPAAAEFIHAVDASRSKFSRIVKSSSNQVERDRGI